MGGYEIQLSCYTRYEKNQKNQQSVATVFFLANCLIFGDPQCSAVELGRLVFFLCSMNASQHIRKRSISCSGKYITRRLVQALFTSSDLFIRLEISDEILHSQGRLIDDESTQRQNHIGQR